MRHNFLKNSCYFCLLYTQVFSPSLTVVSVFCSFMFSVTLINKNCIIKMLYKFDFCCFLVCNDHIIVSMLAVH